MSKAEDKRRKLDEDIFRRHDLKTGFKRLTKNLSKEASLSFKNILYECNNEIMSKHIKIVSKNYVYNLIYI